MSLAQSILKVAFRSLIGRKERVLNIWGLRRSGNHACIHWLANALAGKAITWQELKGHHFMASNDGQIAFINESNLLATRPFFRGLMDNLRAIRNATHLIVSFEDLHPSTYQNWRSIGRINIIIRRNSLDIIASRFHNLNKRAQKGIGWERQSMDDAFFETLATFCNSTVENHVLAWHFEQWKSSESYRLDFLTELGLSIDEMPPVSNIGGGSSFTGTEATIIEADSRLKRVQPQAPWRAFLESILESGQLAYNEEAVAHMKSYLEQS